ncbi:MAG: hypothetical protein WC260_03475 [Candidatus Pacearchaeota archaeon]
MACLFGTILVQLYERWIEDIQFKGFDGYYHWRREREIKTILDTIHREAFVRPVQAGDLG